MRSKARLFVRGGEKAEESIVPVDFWDPRAFTSFVQIWPSGDLRSRIGGVDCQAFGVSFDLRGVLAALPAVEAAAATRSLSVAGNPEWLPAKAALRFAIEKLGARPDLAGEMLIDQSRLGLASARAILMQGSTTGARGQWTQEVREWDVPTWVWEDFLDDASSDFEWELGRLSVKLKGRRDLLTLSGLHFSLGSLKAMLPPDSAKAEYAKALSGRPAAEFWDDLWCAVWGDVYRGDLQPKTKAEIARAMLEWAITNGHDLSDSSAKSRARKMYEALMLEVKNPPSV